jgi:hypothetical protein
MIDLPTGASAPRRRGLGALAGLSFLVLGAGQASALPQVQMAPPPRFLPVQAANPVDGEVQRATGRRPAGATY